MTARLVPLTEELLLWAAAEEADPATATLASTPNWASQFVAPGTMGAALIGEGRVLAAGGLLPQWPGRGCAWLMLSPRASWQDKLRALRVVARTLRDAQHYPTWRRIEMAVRANEPWCDRFAAFAGMRYEGFLRAYDPLGRDYKLFARVAPLPKERG